MVAWEHEHVIRGIHQWRMHSKPNMQPVGKVSFKHLTLSITSELSEWVSVVAQVLMAIVARCCLHTMYEFTAFMNMWAVESLGVSGGVAAQVSSQLMHHCTAL